MNAGLGKKEKDENDSWTATIENIQSTARKSSLFEFTATIDLANPDIAKKYEKSLIFKYDLKEFRLDKYSKDVLFHLVDNELPTRMLQAIIISQYRKKIALKHGINLKPLVLFKSQKIAENKGNLEAFLDMLANLSVEQVQSQKNLTANDEEQKNILEKAFAFFEESGLSFQDLIEELQEDFRRERLLVIDGKNKTSNNLVELNTLELPSNEIRAIFAVDMLNEGWDVLNLFDIVRLYDIRDGKTTKNGFVAGNTTNAEKQLIGRGARYYPFVIDNQIEEKFTRKFDENENNELRVIEQLHYHSANNSRYISELKQVLRESGIFDDVNLEERELKLKESFKQTRTYTEGLVWMNKRLSYQEYVEQRQESLLDTSFIPSSFEVSLPTFNTRDFEAFSEDDIFATDSTNTLNFEFGKEITSNIVRAAINRNKQYTFKNLQKAFFGLSGVSAFIEMLSKVNIIVESSLSQISELTSDQKLYIAEQLLYSIEKDIVPTEERFYGSANFESVPVREVFEENILRKYTVNVNGNAEFGRSQKTKSETEIFENIDQLDWYAYDDNFGTSEEKYLVRAIRELMNDLQEKWSDIYLLRNEKAVKIYSFDEGHAFEPDFILLANDKKVGNTSWQIFIEPKGSQFLDSNNTFKNSKEGWKEKFLLQITERDEARTLLDDERYRIVGLPFFNNEMSREVVNSNLKDL